MEVNHTSWCTTLPAYNETELEVQHIIYNVRVCLCVCVYVCARENVLLDSVGATLAKTKIYHVVNLENVNITILLLFQHCLNLLHNIF